jgi:Predicted acyltransferases
MIMLGVVSVHIVSVYNNQLKGWGIDTILFSSFHASIEVTRMAFMFITGFVLFYVYYERDYNVFGFWKKRFLLVGIPYLFWNIAYLLFIRAVYSPDLFHSFGSFLNLFGESLSRGNLFYMYYILVTLQFYLFFPLMLALLSKFEKQHIHMIIWSFLIQLGAMAWITFEMPKLNTSHWPYLLSHSGSLMLPYLCYFVAGGLAARHYRPIGNYLDKHIRFLTALFVTGFVLMMGHYIFVRTVFHYSYAMSISVQQPVYLPYALLYIGLIMYSGRLWNRLRKRAGMRHFNRVVTLASRTSFGIFLIQPFPIYIINQFVAPSLEGRRWLFYMSLPAAVLFVYFSSMFLAACLLKLPVLSYIIGIRLKWFQKMKKMKSIENPQS